MKKSIYLTVISIITIACIIVGTCFHVIFGFGGFIQNVISSRYEFLNNSDTNNESYSDSNITLDSFKNIVIDTDVIDITVVSGDNFSYSLECTKKLTPSISVTNDTLNITQGGIKNINIFGLHQNFKCKMKLTVPSGTTLNSANITSDVGNIKINNVSFSNMAISTDVGNIDISGITFDKLKITSDVGNINMSDIDGINACDINIASDIGKINYLGTTYRNNCNISSANAEKSVTITTDVGNIDIK